MVTDNSSLRLEPSTKHIDLEESDAFMCRIAESFWTVKKAGSVMKSCEVRNLQIIKVSLIYKFILLHIKLLSVLYTTFRELKQEKKKR